MRCIKTGFYARMPSGLYIHGDAFASGEGEWPNEARIYSDHDLILRVCSMSDEKPYCIHIDLGTWCRWFDEHINKQVANRSWIWSPNSTLIANPGEYLWLGYNGVEP